ncbi:hypothetical protein [Saccharomonospora cyanea]|uniref:hypothetical protein n=1 Tax=Saccharomonospora cyanea TaxID=40989 RepID=UPI0002E0137B|nr:hypothetical protein [Saccharomonospora cyanea]
MRRLGLVVVTAALVTVTLSAGTPVGQVEDVPVAAPEVVCSVDDPRLEELSGLAADTDHVYAVSDGGTQVEVAVLDDACRVREVLTAPTDPYDVEDLALGPGGTLWLGDTGDNRGRRETAAVHALSRDGTSVLYRLTYPDGPQDAEALVVDHAGTPYIITKNVVGSARVYRPAEPLVSPGPTPLEEVGTVSLRPTGTQGGPLGAVGTVLVTGAALSADGSVVALRTYTDAYLYPVVDGDVAAAFTRDPVRVPLPGEAQGEAIAFTPDGTLLSASEGRGEPLRAVRDAVSLVGAQPDGRAEPKDRAASAPEEPVDRESGLGLAPALAVAAVLAAVLVAWGSRRRR